MNTQQLRESRLLLQLKGPAAQSGIGLIELMIALVIGLVISGATFGLYLSNREVFRVNEQLSRVQESARTAFELMARSAREAGSIPCGGSIPLSVVVKDLPTNWWANWPDTGGLKGFDNAVFGVGSAPPPSIEVGDGSLAGKQKAGTDAILMISADANTSIPVESTTPAAAKITLGTAAHGLTKGTVALVCDYSAAAVFQISSVNGKEILHEKDSGTPGNAIDALGPGATAHNFTGGQAMRLRTEIWWIGYNGRPSTTSLYRTTLITKDDKADTRIEEIAEGITDLQLSYLISTAGVLATDYVDAATVTADNWKNREPVAIRVTMTGTTTEKVAQGVATPAQIQRKFYHVISLRNRLS